MAEQNPNKLLDLAMMRIQGNFQGILFLILGFCSAICDESCTFGLTSSELFKN